MDSNINLGLRVNKNSIISSMAMNMDYDEIIEFIKELDLYIGDWGFTNKLIAFAKEAELEYEKEDIKSELDSENY